MKKLPFLHIFLIAVAIIVCYWQVGGFDFLYLWDDQWQVINHRTSKGLTCHNLRNIFTTIEYGQYSPINQLYYTIIHLFGGYNPRWYHIGNLILHLLNTLLLYYMGYKLLRTFSYSNKASLYISWIAALLVAVHPVNVETVCWVSASKILLGCLFYYLAILAYGKYNRSRKKTFLAIGIFLAFCSAGSKEQVVTLCFCLLLIDRYVLERNMSSLRIYAEKLYYVLPGLIILSVTMWTNRNVDEITVGYAFIERLLFCFYSLFGYMQMSLFPIKLSYLYPFPYLVGEDISAWLWIYPAVVCFIGYLLYSYRKSRLLCLCALYFVLQLIPVLHIIPLPRYFIMANRYLYMPYAAIALLAGVGIYKVYQSRWKLLLILFLPYLSYLAYYTRSYATDWQNSTTLKQNVNDILKQREN